MREDLNKIFLDYETRRAKAVKGIPGRAEVFTERMFQDAEVVADLKAFIKKYAKVKDGSE